jgi:peptidoglycan/xylan/chitin deacetylase (PgdA/CDA1 family)
MLDVYITVDTETSLGGAWQNAEWKPVHPERAILGRIGSKLYGLPLIMDILEENELRATFFAEVLAGEVVGSAELAEAYAPIRKRGHDPQLHLHPVFHYYHLVTQGLLRRDQLPPRMDLIGALPFESQLALLEKGQLVFRDFFGVRPTAFRAGCYGASMCTLDALERIGIRYDSSFNAAYLGGTCLMNSKRPTNTPWRNGALWEMPVTTFETGVWKMRSLKPLEVSAVSLREMQVVLEQAERLGQHSVTVMMHCFAFLKRADVQFRRMRPDRLVIRRFRNFCRYLRRHRNRFRVLTFSEIQSPPCNLREVPFAQMGILIPSARKFMQVVNRIYRL